MFDETLVVQSAVSAFNNAALAAPTFFWLGLLSVPLMALAYFYGNDFLRRIGWHSADLKKNSAILTIALILIWITSFGGNYGVLRDSTSVLPFCMAALVFFCTFVLSGAARGITLPAWRGVSWRRRLVMVAVFALVAFFVGMSGMQTWWGVLIQIVAFFGGAVIGRFACRGPRALPAGLIVAAAVATVMLMQPEFFRFGQLGALSVLHMGVLLLIGGAVAATAVLRNVHPRGKIHRSAYVKLKWMARFVSALGIVLFLLTESVPVFLGTLAALTAMFAMSVWHADSLPDGLDDKMWAVTLCLLGLAVTVPVISVMGVLVWINAPSVKLYEDSKFLL